MADTIQVVSWALGQRCPLRTSPDWYEPKTTLYALHDLQFYSKLRGRPEYGARMHGDICVYSTTSTLPREKNSKYRYPFAGMILSSQFSRFGGLPSVYRLCGDCPANDRTGGLAGCTGTFFQALYSNELQDQLERLIDRLNLAATLDRCFLETQPLWYRFWIESPLKPEAATALLQLLEAVFEEDAEDLRKSGAQDRRGIHSDLGAFVEALQRSITSGLPMHVSLAPPGHTDFGWYTIFPHCPRCKSEAPVARWKRKYKDEPIACLVCSQVYSPAATYSASRENWKREDLRESLGQEEFEKFAKKYLMDQGASDAEAAEIVEAHEKREREGREKLKRDQEAFKRNDLFIKEVLYHGLRNLRSAADEEQEWLFSPADVEEIFRRCEAHGGTVHYITHISESGDHDEYLRITGPAREALLQLIEKGCREKFSLTVKIPQDVVEHWWSGRQSQ